MMLTDTLELDDEMATASERLAALEATVDGLKDWLDKRFELSEKHLAERFVNQEKTLDKSEIAQAARNLVANEFRASLSDQASRFMPRVEIEAEMRTIRELVRLNSARLDKADGRTGGIGSSLAVIVAVVSALLSLGTMLAMFLNK